MGMMRGQRLISLETGLTGITNATRLEATVVQKEFSPLLRVKPDGSARDDVRYETTFLLATGETVHSYSQKLFADCEIGKKYLVPIMFCKLPDGSYVTQI